MNPRELLELNAELEGTIFQDGVHHMPVIDSTNALALAEAQRGAASGGVYLADQQTAGRGRGGHTWHSGPDGGLYLTALVRPRLPAQQALLISLHTGIAASLAIEDVTGYRIDLRWPNDLVAPPSAMPAKKFGGILVETAVDRAGMLRHAAIGIGINLNQASFPAELAETATSLHLALRRTVSRDRMAAAFLRRLHQELINLESGSEEAVLRRFAERSTWIHGKPVHVREGEGYTGTTAGFTSEGLLRIACSSGAERIVRHGAVRELMDLQKNA